MTTEAARGGKQPKKQTRKQERGLEGGERTRNEKNGGSRTRTKKANVRQEFGMKNFFSLQLKTFQFSHSKLNQHNDDCKLSLP